MSVRAAVVDSSGWIELFTDGPQASRFVALLDSEATLVVPVISILEVFKWVLREPAQLLPLAAALVLAISWRLAWPRRWKLLGVLLVSLTLSCIYSPASTARAAELIRQQRAAAVYVSGDARGTGAMYAHH